MFIRQAHESDWAQIWPIVREAFASGDTYAYSPAITSEEAYDIWMAKPTAVYASVENNKITGTYYIKPNYPELGAHICNAGYIVHSSYRNKGIGRAMCAHSLEEAVKLGFKAMQYNN